MADMLLTHVVSSLLNRKELQVDSRRVSIVKENVRVFLSFVEKEENKIAFSAFSTKLFALIMDCVITHEKKQLWSTIGELQRETLPKMWQEFLVNIGCESVTEDPLFFQMTSEALAEIVIKDKYDTQSANSSSAELETSALLLTKDEENIIRYACGYVGMKLHKKFIHQDTLQAQAFVNCLESMHVPDDSITPESLLDYTKEWTIKVNRGGLFVVSNEGYELFLSIERSMRPMLQSRLVASSSVECTKNDDSKLQLVRKVVENPNVLRKWNCLSAIIEKESDRAELLKQIVTLWLTIRGYSLTKAWMEDYKNVLHATSKKKKSLRKELQRHGDACTQ